MKTKHFFTSARLLRFCLSVFLLWAVTAHARATKPLLSVPQKEDPSQDIMNPENKGGQYRAFFSLGLLPGSMEIIQTTPISLGMTHGYYYKGAFIGAGMAVENFQPAFLPVFADGRIFLGKKKVQPYIRGIVGKTFLFPSNSYYADNDREKKGKVVAGIGGGVSYPVGPRSFFYFYLGYRYMKYVEEYKNGYGNPVTENYTFKRMEFRVGFSF